MKQFFNRVVVTTVPSQIFDCAVKDLQNVEIYAIGAMEFGSSGVSMGTGIPLAAGESRSISHIDFRKDDKSIQEDRISIYGVSVGSVSCQVSGWRK